MVNLSLVQSNNAALVASQSLVAVVVGGTSNIGAHTVKCLAGTHGQSGKGLRLYIIGRNRQAAEEVMSDCRTVCPTGQYHFIRAHDLALLKDVDLVCGKLAELEEKEAKTMDQKPRIDILIMSQAIFKPWDGRLETIEGLDTFMSLLYYSRMRFTTNLLPLLLPSSLPARVISIFGPGRDASWFPSDLSLRSPKNYGFMSSGSHAAYFMTFFFEYLAAQHPGKLALIHYYPGLVLSDAFIDPTLPYWLRAFVKYFGWLVKLAPMSLSGKESGQRTLFNASDRFPPRPVDGEVKLDTSHGSVGVAESSDGVVGGGAYRVYFNGGPVALGNKYKTLREEGWLEKVVEHTQQAFSDIITKGTFTG